VKISILSAVYNEAAHIGEMVQSVLSQSEIGWELLFVDDGSTDNSVDVIRRFAGEDCRIRLVSHGVKLGKVSAFNKAFAESKGDVIVLLAGDDRLPPDSLSIRYRAMAAVGHDSPAAAFFKIRTFSKFRKFDGMVLPRGKSSSRSGGSIAMNRTLAEILFPIEESLVSEDIWLGAASVDLASSIIQKSDVVLEYRIHDGNSNPRNRPFDEMTESICAHRIHANKTCRPMVR
jgi:glycosyltransferase involved in cell wall biosynthesis